MSTTLSLVTSVSVVLLIALLLVASAPVARATSIGNFEFYMDNDGELYGATSGGDSPSWRPVCAGGFGGQATAVAICASSGFDVSLSKYVTVKTKYSAAVKGGKTFTNVVCQSSGSCIATAAFSCWTPYSQSVLCSGPPLANSGAAVRGRWVGTAGNGYYIRQSVPAVNSGGAGLVQVRRPFTAAWGLISTRSSGSTFDASTAFSICRLLGWRSTSWATWLHVKPAAGAAAPAFILKDFSACSSTYPAYLSQCGFTMSLDVSSPTLLGNAVGVNCDPTSVSIGGGYVARYVSSTFQIKPASQGSSGNFGGMCFLGNKTVAIASSLCRLVGYTQGTSAFVAPSVAVTQVYLQRVQCPATTVVSNFSDCSFVPYVPLTVPGCSAASAAVGLSCGGRAAPPPPPAKKSGISGGIGTIVAIVVAVVIVLVIGSLMYRRKQAAASAERMAMANNASPVPGGVQHQAFPAAPGGMMGAGNLQQGVGMMGGGMTGGGMAGGGMMGAQPQQVEYNQFQQQQQMPQAAFNAQPMQGAGQMGGGYPGAPPGAPMQMMPPPPAPNMAVGGQFQSPASPGGYPGYPGM